MLIRICYFFLSRIRIFKIKSEISQDVFEFGPDPYLLENAYLKHNYIYQVLLAKQELAEKMGVNDEKFVLMKKKYEDALNKLEDEIGMPRFLCRYFTSGVDPH